MATLTAEVPVAGNEVKQPAKTRERPRRRRGSRIVDESGARYFLVNSSGSDKMELAEEAASESEAMVTAFRTGGSFAVVTEWKTVADLSNGQPVIKKEAVRKEKK
jgi:hypothetical protein